MHPDEREKINIEKPALEKGGASFKGLGESIQADYFSGDNCFTIPLPITEARALTPDVDLKYRSSWGNGLFGLGFQIDIPTIRRKTANKLPLYTDEIDRFIYSGKGDLILDKMDKQGEWDVWVFQAEKQKDFLRIEFWRESKPGGEKFWKTISTTGIISYYGKSMASRMADPDARQNIYAWLIDSSIDANGNKIEYKYYAKDANRYISNIYYGNYFDQGIEKFAYEIKFDYNLGQEAGRTDVFVSYRAGFKIETTELCRRLQMIHHFEGVSRAVREVVFRYSTAGASTLTEIQITGYRYDEDGNIDYIHLPALQMGYTPFSPEGASFAPLDIEQGVLPDKLKKGRFRFVDLYGEGISGVLYGSGEGVWYYEPLGKGRFGKPQLIDPYPIDKDLKNPKYTFKSLDGNGILDLVVESRDRSGFYEQKNKQWHNFRSFLSFPNEIELKSKVSVDLQGDGLGHLLFSEPHHTKYYPSLKKEGYAPPIMAPQSGFPSSVHRDSPFEKVFFVDIFGDGLSHCVKVSNGSVTCWPNIGYGRFGNKVELEGFSFIHENFNTKNIYFADLKGLGPVDLLYASGDKLDVYFNRGDGHFLPPVSFSLPHGNDNLCEIDFCDLLGNGTSAMVLTKLGVEVTHQYLDFCQGQKPFLLNSFSNGMGYFTKIEYISAVNCYIQDKMSAKPWNQTIPFPVYVVGKIENEDRIAGIRDKTEFCYKDPVYDSAERSLAGFGFVEETVYRYRFNEGLQQEEAPYILHTKRWYHTGMEKDVLEKQFYQKEASSFGNCIWDIKSEIYKEQAKKALWGNVIREETYLAEDSAGSVRLHSINCYYYTVRQCTEAQHIQDISPLPKQSFFVNQHEKMTFTYDGGGSNTVPLARQELIVETDRYGHTVKGCEIFYETHCAPLVAISHLTDYSYCEVENQAICAPIQKRKYDLSLAKPEEEKKYYTLEECRERLAQALENTIPYGTPFLAGKNQARLNNWEKTVYWNENQMSPLPFGQSSFPALVHHQEQAVFSESFYEQVVGFDISGNILKEQAGYYFDEGYWWNRGLVSAYASKEQFYLISKMENNFTNPQLYSATRIEYDKYGTLPVLYSVWVSGEVGENVTTTEIDYQCMKYKKITDINDNIEEVVYDPLGNVKAYTRYGLCDGQMQGNGGLEKYTSLNGTIEDVLSNPQAYLQNAAAYYHYDYYSFVSLGCPLFVAEISNPRLDATLGIIRQGISYYDGRGCMIEKKEKEKDRWAVTEYTVYQEKEKPVLQYRPFFSQTPNFDNLLADKPVIVGYDGLLREIWVKTPHILENITGYFCRKNIYNPGEVVSINENALVKEASFYESFMEKSYQGDLYEDQLDALKKAEKACGLETSQIFDAQGNVILQNLGDGQLVTYVYDCNRRIIKVSDSRLSALGRSNMQYIYDMSGNKIKTINCDMGNEVLVLDIYNKPVYRQDAKGIETISRYDGLSRLTEKWADGILVEKIMYGEEVPDSKNNNLRGQIFKSFDQSGIETKSTYNIYYRTTAQTKELCTEYSERINWNQPVSLEQECWREEFHYDRENKILWCQQPDGSRVESAYNERGLLASKTYRNGAETEIIIHSIEYDAAGRITEEMKGNGVVSQLAYNAAGMLAKSTSKKSGGALLCGQLYCYDPCGNITRIRDVTPVSSDYFKGQTAPSYLDYTYDRYHQLVEATGRELPQTAAQNDLKKLETYKETYFYDMSGNLTCIKHSSPSTNWVRNFEICDAGSRVQSVNGVSVNYDANGNLTALPRGASFQWDYANRLVKSDVIPRDVQDSDSEFYVYNSDGQRIRKILHKKISDGLTRQEEKIYIGNFEIKRIYQQQVESQLIFERYAFHMSDEKTSGTVRYMWAKDDLKRETNGDKTQKTIYRIGDHLQSIRLETDETGRVITEEEFSPFGETVFFDSSAVEVCLKEYRFSGKEKDTFTGLYYFNSRYYLAGWGRMISGDGFEYFKASEWLDFNRYAYCHNNPIKYVDEDGHVPQALDWSYMGPQGNETRIAHIGHHLANIPGRRLHGVFAGQTPQTIQGFVNSVWARSDRPDVDIQQQGHRTVYTIPHDNAGYEGGQTGAANGNPVLHFVKIVVDNQNPRRIITAFPVRGTPAQEAARARRQAIITATMQTAARIAVSIAAMGAAVGMAVGATRGSATGGAIGAAVGATVGAAEGAFVGMTVGAVMAYTFVNRVLRTL